MVSKLQKRLLCYVTFLFHHSRLYVFGFCRSKPLGCVPSPALLWPLTKYAAHGFVCSLRLHRSQRGASVGTDGVGIIAWQSAFEDA